MTNTVFALIVFDISNRKTFEKLEDNYITVYNNNCMHENKIIVIVGNKSDNQARQVTEEEGRALATRYGFNYIETSAKTGENIEKVFQCALEQFCQNLKD